MLVAREPAVHADRLTRFVDGDVLTDAVTRTTAALHALASRTCEGAAQTGWLELPSRMLDGELDAIERTADRLRGRHDALVVIGIGGSSLGARAALSALGHGAEAIPSPLDSHPVVFAGHHLDTGTLDDTLHSLESRDFAVNIISKSGTTTEPGIAARVFLHELRRRHGDDWCSRVVATTDAETGALRALANEHRLESFVVPPDVGGRFSVLSPVGLLPLAYAGVDCRGMLEAATESTERLLAAPSIRNPAVRLASARHALGLSGYTVDVLAFTSPRLRHFAAWWQQLFGESEGKQHRGPFPALLEIPADLHSLGQYMQDGARQVYETFLHADEARTQRPIPDGDTRDGLDYLEGRPISAVLDAARGGTVEAHEAGGVPVIEISAGELSAGTLGRLFMLFEVTVALGGALLDVNPFDQPGVEAYKANMFRLLGRPG